MTNINSSEILVIGLMSGTSLDGLDLSYSRYYKKRGDWKFELLKSHTYEYSKELKLKFSKVYENKISLNNFDKYFTDLIIKYLNLFIKSHNIHVDLISSHGHTIFHQPDLGYTKQIGNGHQIFQSLRIPVVCNFREQDVILGGQGAPLVPIGDKLLFNQYDACLNLGGIANISYEFKGSRLAFDICPCNIVLNYLSNIKGLVYDFNGKMAKLGQVNHQLLLQLNNIPYYTIPYPKSLGKEYIDDVVMPIIKSSSSSNNDLLSTFVEHIAMQIAVSLKNSNSSNCLLTGGGVFNKYLISRISYYTTCEIIIPNNNLINFKESIVFGLLGVLRLLNVNNCLASVTGADHDHCSGSLHN